MTSDDIRAGLTNAGARRADARVTEQDAMTEITYWLRRGQGVLSVTEMSRLSGVTRETIYQLLRPTDST
jgi:hypothetical protein